MSDAATSAAPGDVPRLTSVGPELLEHHGHRGEPVVLTAMFDDTPLRALDTWERFRRELGGLRLSFRPEYGRLLLDQLSHGPIPSDSPHAVTATIEEYYAQVERDPTTPMMCVEEATPPALAERFAPPAVCAADEDRKTTVFVGNRGNRAPIHFDGDCRHVLLYQVFGRKRVFMFPPEAGPRLRSIANFSTLLVDRLPDDERRAVVGQLGGWECEIGPGEAVFMPALVWHGVQYLDDGMGVNHRFGRHHRHRFVSDHLHLDHRVQRFAARSLDPRALDGEERGRWRRVVEAWATPSPTAWQKYLELVGLLDEILGPTDDPPALDDALFAPIPDAAREALLRLHLFKERLYLHRSPMDASIWS
ncbi:MAG: cupin-like domain-containing protein [Polyangiaceae bacterium]